MPITPTVCIEKDVFDEMLSHMELLDKIVTTLFEKLSDKSMSDWVDSEFACSFLNISSRTLRSYKEHGVVPYTKLGKTTIFRCSDISKLVK